MESPTDASDADDWRLVQQARSGDEAAYARLIARHQEPIHAFIRRHVGTAPTARDLTEEVFVRAWFALERVQKKARFTTWLFQIAINLCRDHAKSKATRKARATVSLVRPEDDERASEREWPDPSRPPDEEAQWAESLRALDEEIARLPVKLREAFLLGAVQNHPQKEVAAMLGVTPKAVETRIRRARKILASRLTERGHLGSGS